MRWRTAAGAGGNALLQRGPVDAVIVTVLELDGRVLLRTWELPDAQAANIRVVELCPQRARRPPARASTPPSSPARPAGGPTVNVSHKSAVCSQ